MGLKVIHPMRSPTVKGLAKCFVSVVLLIYLFVKVDLAITFDIVYLLPATVIAIAAGMFFFSVWINSLKWHLLLPQYGILDLLKTNLIGLFYGLVLPGQLFGEGAKGYYLIKNQGETKRVVASIFVDKITGLIGLLVVSIAGVFWSQHIVSRQFVGVFSLCLLACITVLFALRIDVISSLAADMLGWLGRRSTRVNRVSLQLVQILQDWRAYLHRPGLIAKTVFLGVVFQLLCVLTTMILGAGLNIRLPLADWCWIFGIVSIALLIPMTIGGVGLREGAFVGLLGYCGVPGEKALALSLTAFAVQLLGVILGGILNFQAVSGTSGRCDREKTEKPYSRTFFP